MKNFLTKYFNERTATPAIWTGISAAMTAFNFASGGSVGLAAGALMAGVTAYSANNWKRAATGRGFW